MEALGTLGESLTRSHNKYVAGAGFVLGGLSFLAKVYVMRKQAMQAWKAILK